MIVSEGTDGQRGRRGWELSHTNSVPINGRTQEKQGSATASSALLNCLWWVLQSGATESGTTSRTVTHCERGARGEGRGWHGQRMNQQRMVTDEW